MFVLELRRVTKNIVRMAVFRIAANMIVFAIEY